MPMKRMFPLDVIRQAVLRVLAGKTTTTQEAARIGCSIRTVENAVLKAKRKLGAEQLSLERVPGAVPVAGGEGGTPAGVGEDPAAGISKEKESAALGEALRAAGVEKPAAPITGVELTKALTEARAVDENYCLTTLRDVKGALVALAGMTGGVPLSDERLFKCAELGEYAKDSVRTNAGELAPLLRKYVGNGLYAVAVALAIDALASWGAVRKLAVEYAEKRRREKPKEPPPPPAAEKPNEPVAA